MTRTKRNKISSSFFLLKKCDVDVSYDSYISTQIITHTKKIKIKIKIKMGLLTSFAYTKFKASDNWQKQYS